MAPHFIPYRKQKYRKQNQKLRNTYLQPMYYYIPATAQNNYNINK